MAHSLRLHDLDYEYPDDLVARHPVEPRDAARLLVVDRATGAIEHRHFRDLPDYHARGDVVVVNDTQVFPARLFGTKESTGARVEIFLLRQLNAEQRLWECLVSPARKVRVGNRVIFEGGLVADVLDNTAERSRTVRFLFDGDDAAFQALIDRIGSTPLPPYLKRDEEPADRADYQTVFAAHRGAVAAPTAGLHFTDGLLGRLRTQGTAVAPLTLHVGLGTFRAVEVEDVTKHVMDAEAFTIPEPTALAVNETRTKGTGKVTAVGTTAVRALESGIGSNGHLVGASGWTDTYIYPPYTFRVVDRLVTNFHMPRTSLLLLVSAFMGYDLMREAYRVAIAERYRLFSYGDAMLIL